MTIRIPGNTFEDRILALIGKKRALWIPKNAYRQFGLYVIIQARKESFWRALLRPKNQEPPDGWFYCDNIHFN